MSQPGRPLIEGLAIERRVIRTKTGEVHSEVVEGLTSPAVEAAAPQRVLGFLRDHRRIENKSHWLRDVSFDESSLTAQRVNNILMPPKTEGSSTMWMHTPDDQGCQ